VRIAAFVIQGQTQVGQVSPDGQTITAFDLSPEQHALGGLSLVDAHVKGQPVPASKGPAHAINSVTLLAPVPKPRRNIWCVGRNYHEHAKELQGSVFKANNANPAVWPIVFTKVPESVVPNGAAIELPGASITEQIDYEAELAVIIGKGGKNIARQDAMPHVYGYTIVNDVTARDVQMRHQQWDMGKSFDTFCPMGPWIVTADELDGTHTRVQCWVNGEKRQDALTTDLIFDIPTLIETISRGITLYPGDIIATGTPAGVGLGMTPPVFLQKGDVVRIEIDGIGVLENPVT
jgi:2-keto-4-pentenoate hydratase/2-oxohepta-3-ene-1,7-dioic acid hydratase in catechol pathway